MSTTGTWFGDVMGAPATEGKLAITRIYLRPRVKFEGEAPTREKILSLHEKAHEICFIASSLKSEIVLELQE